MVSITPFYKKQCQLSFWHGSKVKTHSHVFWFNTKTDDGVVLPDPHDKLDEGEEGKSCWERGVGDPESSAPID
jgi:hypothetical protein